MKKNWKWVGCVVLLVVALFVLKNRIGGMGSTPDSVLTVYDDETEETTIYVNGKLIDSVRGQVAVYHNEDYSANYITTTEDEIYFLKGTKLRLIPDGVELVRIADHSEEALILDAKGVLYLCNGKDLMEITSQKITSAQISGNGKYFAYNADGNGYFGRKSGDVVEVEDAIIRHISEDGKYIYAYEYEEEIRREGMVGGRSFTSDYSITNDFNLLLVDKKGNTERLAEDVSEVVAMNKDGSEIMYLQDDGTYISVKGKERRMVCEETVVRIYYKSEGENLFYPAKSLKETVAIVKKAGREYGYLINGKYEAKQITDESYEVYGVNDKLTRMYYVNKNRELCVARVTEGAEGEVLAEHVDDAWMSNDGKHIYYASQNSDMEHVELYYIKNHAEPENVGTYDIIRNFQVVGDEGFVVSGEFLHLRGTVAEKYEEFDSVEVDSVSGTLYGKKGNCVYEIDGGRSKELEGSYEKIDYISCAY